MSVSRLEMRQVRQFNILGFKTAQNQRKQVVLIAKSCKNGLFYHAFLVKKH